MIEIKDLLAKFDHLLSSEEIKKETIASVISKIINIGVKPKDIKIQNHTVYLNIKPIYKNEIFLKKEKIFFELKKHLNNKIPQNIR